MIIARIEGRLRAITQNDHAHLAGELLSLWTRDGLPEHPRRESLLFAARQHDNGWRETDSAPHLNPDSKRPHDFLSLPIGERQRLWNRGLNRFVQSEPYASALILRHALHLHRSRREDSAWIGTLEHWQALADTLREDQAFDPADIENDYPWIDLTDLLSLGFCARWSEAFDRYGYQARWDLDAIFLQPFPLAGETTFRVPCRFIDDDDYASDSDLGVALASARWQTASVRVRRFPSSSSRPTA